MKCKYCGGEFFDEDYTLPKHEGLNHKHYYCLDCGTRVVVCDNGKMYFSFFPRVSVYRFSKDTKKNQENILVIKKD